MAVDKKKSITLKNRTKYFIAGKDKTHVTFGSPYSYLSRVMKIEGYETRLYWHFRYLEENDGQTYFYTLTYNDNALPKHYGRNCFDYEDLRDLLTGGFRKQLLRKYGTIFKYFVGAELGDGKGSRGMANNPHYHVLFFLENANSERFPYVKITPEQFRNLVRKYWQGFDQDTDGFMDFNAAKYGIAKEGENCGKVTDFRAIQYVAKYVCKDVKLMRTEYRVRQYVELNEKRRLKDSVELYKGFYLDVIRPMYNIPLNPSQTEWKYSDYDLCAKMFGKCFTDPFDFGDTSPYEFKDSDYYFWSIQIVKDYDLRKELNNYLNQKVEDKVKEKITEWRNRFCNKCRISQAVGDYALQFVDKTNPTFLVPDKKGFKVRPCSMYYYRKLFTNVIRPTTKTFTGKIIQYPPIRVLNEDGINYKVERLDRQIEKKIIEAKTNLNIVLGDPELFEEMKKSDINTQVFYTYDEFFRRYNYLLLENEENKNEMFRRYAEYKLVYENRYCTCNGYGDYGFPDIMPHSDLRRFLVPSVYSTCRNDFGIDTFLNGCDEDFISYAEHPYFLQYIGIFGVLDLCADYFFVKGDNEKQKEAEQIAETKRFHTERNLREFYAQFGL